MSTRSLIMSVIILTVAAAVPVSAEPAPQSVIDYANASLTSLGTDKTIVDAVKAENAKGKSLDQIKAADAVWIEASGVTGDMRKLIDSDCGKRLISFRDEHEFITEVFVMDNQGANVAMSEKTSDYWQGDEDKFIKCFNAGNGTVFVSDVNFDENTQVYQVQVSVPVTDGSATIGAICIGIDLDLFE